jgi:mannonate dehydratase
MSQIGLDCVVLQGTDWVDAEGKGYWTSDDLRPLQIRCAEYDLKLHSLMIPLGWLMSPMLEKPDRSQWYDNISRSIRAAGETGIEMLEWRWSPDFKRGEDVGYYSTKGRGGAVHKAFDHSRVASQPPFEDVGEISRDQLWGRLTEFTSAVLPAAEEAGVALSLHPKDPPVKRMRGVHRLLTNAEQIEEFVDKIDSPANGFTFCQGTVTEMGVDVPDAIRRIGGRGKIHHVHFRGVRGSVPQFVETFVDEGDVDMLEAMRAFKQVDYRGSLASDHTPQIIGDWGGGLVGRSYSHGYIRGLVEAVNAEGTAAT